MKITMAKADVIAILEKNRQEHIDTYQETVDAWQKALQEYTDALNAWAFAGGDRSKRPAEPPKPHKYTQSYNEHLTQLRYHILDTVELDNSEYREIVQNKFGWSGHFYATNSSYTGRLASSDDENDEDEPF
jgi:hypothetical protein